MKSALECFFHAERCDRTADTMQDGANRTTLRTTAGQWRRLAEMARARERSERQDTWPPAAKNAIVRR